MRTTVLKLPVQEWLSGQWTTLNGKPHPQFFLLRISDNPQVVLTKIVSKVTEWSKEYRNKLESILDLQWSPLQLDYQGNVCFADDPDLRPEFRTQFTSLNLWDYCYAAIHDSHFSTTESIDVEISSLIKDEFWSIVELGQKLRVKESMRRSVHEASDFTISGTGSNLVEPLNIRFSSVNTEHQTGNLFLNSSQFIQNVPGDLWNFSRSGFRPLEAWIEEHIDQSFSTIDFGHFKYMIETLRKNQRVYHRIDAVLQQR